MAELESRLGADAAYVSERDRRIRRLDRRAERWKNLYRLSEAEVLALKASWSYRVGRIVVAPGRLLKASARRLAAAGRVRTPTPNERPPADLRARWTERYRALRERPVISIVLPVYETDPRLLRTAVESVFEQVYEEWELCIADDGSTRRATRDVLDELAARDPERVRCERLDVNRGIAAASSAAARLASGEWLAFLDHDDRLAPQALLEMAVATERFPDADLLYSDEGKLDARGRCVEPFHKPDFSPELLLASNYLCHLTVVRSSVFWQVGGLREGFDGSQDHDLVLRASEVARRVVHVPEILYHWRKTPGSAAASELAKGGPWRESSRRALRAAVERRAWDAVVENGIVPGTYRVRLAVNAARRVTIVIPTRDRIDLLERCVESVHRHTRHPSFEILVVSNRSVERRTHEYLARASALGRLRHLRHDGPFNFSAINNRAAAASDSPFLLFLNNDTEVDGDGWLEAMLEFAQQEPIGAVGAKLLYPDRTVQHAGVVLGLMGVAGHAHRGLPDGSHGYFGQADVVRNCSAVTGACLLTRREVFERVGGFDEELAVAYNDVDFCLKVREAGYRIVYTPYARLIHHESLSRGADDLPHKRARFHTETEALFARWGERLRGDPYHNPNLALWSEDVGPRPASEDLQDHAFAAAFPAVGVEATTAVAGALAGAAPRAGYKAVWEALSASERDAKLHVMGSTDEEQLAREARRTVGVLQSTVTIDPRDTVLEVGCGIGRVGAALAPRCRRWIGCDVSGRMLAHAARRLAALPNVELIEVSGFELAPVPDRSVDVVYCTVVFMHLDEWDRFAYVAEAHRVLRHGGRLFVDNVNLLSDEGWAVFEAHRALPADERPAHISKTSTPQELEGYLRRAGFHDVRCAESGPWVRCWGVR